MKSSDSYASVASPIVRMHRFVPRNLLSLATLCLAGCDATEQSPADVDVLAAADLPGDPKPVDERDEAVPEVEERVERIPIPTCDDLTDAAPLDRGHTSGQREHIEFVDVTDAWGLPSMYTPTVSVGDVNGDGAPDVYAAGWGTWESFRLSERVGQRHSIFLLCGEQFFEHRLGVGSLNGFDNTPPRASHIADMDGDGYVDIVVAFEGYVEALYQHPEGGFDAVRIWEREPRYNEIGRSRRGQLVDLTIADIDADGIMDIYLSHYGGTNPLLRGLPGREYAEAVFERPDLAQATSGETFASALITPPHAEGVRMLYLAHHAEPDQIWSLDADFETDLLVGGIHPHASMGIDYFYLPDRGGVVVLVAESRGSHFFLIDAEGYVDLQETPYLFGILRDEWGVQVNDFDNDGEFEAVFPTGDMADDDGADDPVDHRLFLAEFRDGAGPDPANAEWYDASATAGPAFDGTQFGEHIAVVSADLDRDGCVDLIATPMPRYSNNPATLSFSQPVTVWRNQCGYAGNWIGFTLDDPGALLSVTVDGTNGPVVRSADSQPGSGLGCDGASEQIHIGLGPDSNVQELEVRCSAGDTVMVAGDDLRVNAYNDLRHLCTRGELKAE